MKRALVEIPAVPENTAALPVAQTPFDRERQKRIEVIRAGNAIVQPPFNIANNRYPQDTVRLAEGKDRIHTYFDLADHGARFSSVSKVLETIFPHGDLIEKNRERWQANDKSKYHGMTDAKTQENWDYRRDRGTINHEMLELFFLDKLPLEELCHAALLVLEHLATDSCFTHLRVKRVEHTLFDRTTRLSGTGDVTFEVLEGDTSYEAGTLVIGDWKFNGALVGPKNGIPMAFNNWKTNTRVVEYANEPFRDIQLCNVMQYKCQMHYYGGMYERNYGEKVSACINIHCNPDGIIMYGIGKETPPLVSIIWKYDPILTQRLFHYRMTQLLGRSKDERGRTIPTEEIDPLHALKDVVPPPEVLAEWALTEW